MSGEATADRTNSEWANPPQKRVKQEDGAEAPSGDVMTASSVRPPASFLDLPDDILLPIFEELYEQRYESITSTTPLRIAEILINKRIFLLARPLWHKRLSITEAQLDARLSGLLEDKTRQASLSSLKLPLSNTFANLTKTVISLLPRLTELSLAFDENVQGITSKLVADRIAGSDSLRRLTLSTSDSLFLATRFSSRYKAQNPSRRADVLLTHGDHLVQSVGHRSGRSLCSYRYGRGYAFNWSSASWNRAHSINLFGLEGLVIPAETLITTLQNALSGATSQADIVSEFPLHALGIDLQICPEDQATNGLFTMATFQTFFGLLESSDLRQLELRQLETIPTMADGYRQRSLELLRLSGTVDLRAQLELPSLLALLNCFSSLRQLHLVGSFFSSANLPADSMSKFETMPLYFHYPQLCTLLTYLRQSQVLIFTYRGSNEDREMRWTRLTTEDEFDRDCWTL